MPKIQTPGRGLVPRGPIPKSEPTLFSYGAIPYDWTTAPSDDGQPGPNQFGIPDKNQGQSGSCTEQAEGYGFFHATLIDASRNDPYSHVFLPPSGGAYLDAPENWKSLNGHLLLSQFPDPNPETEANMEKIITLPAGVGRTKTFSIKTNIISPVSIDAVAQAVQNHTYVKLGIKYTGTGFSKSWTDPYFDPSVAFEGHAIACFKDSVVIRKGKKAIKAKSSWCGSVDATGNANYAHFINENYFNAGGVFEIVAVDVKEITMPNPNNETIYTVSFNGKAGLMFQGGYGANIIYANNPAHYAELGDAYSVNTCKPDPANPGQFIFSPFDITINVPVSTAPAARP